MTRPVLVGPAAIWLGGWTPQVHRRRHLAVPDGWSGPPGQGDILVVVSQQVHTQLLMLAIGGDAYTALPPRLDPAHALAHALATRCVPAVPPDEIDPDYLDRDERDAVAAALATFGVVPARIEELMRGYDGCLRGPGADPGLR